MKTGSLSSLRSHISQSGKHLSGLRSDLHSRLGHFRHHRSASEQQALTEDFSRVLTAWGIDDAAAIPGVVRALRLRFPLFVAPVLVCAIAAILLQNTVSCLALAFVAPPCLLGIVTTAWRLSILKNRRFLPLFRWLEHFTLEMLTRI
jgi:hypothetical protein